MANANLVKVDRNGSKHWESDVCPRCNGTGRIEAYNYVEGGICFLCNGSGKHHHTWIERTPEYEEVLRKSRVAKKNAKFWEKYPRTAWCVAGDTYAIKDELKEKGARYDRVLGWYFAEPVEGYTLVECAIESYMPEGYDGIIDMMLFDKVRLDAEKIAALPKRGEYIGEVGDKVEFAVTLERIGSYCTNYTYYGEMVYVYTFANEDGDALVWKTQKELDIEEGANVILKGTVKGHSEYKGQRQTVLTRCKVA